MRKYVLFGNTGSGKSTSTQLVREYYERKGMRVAVVKLAEPLYELQQQFYQKAGRSIRYYDQDQPLLQTIASQLRRIAPTSLIDDFMQRLARTQADVVINDDLRDPHVDYPMIREQGFTFVRVRASDEVRLKRLRLRGDQAHLLHAENEAGLDQIRPDYVITNETDEIEVLRSQISRLLEALE